jgi:nucleotide-binding universal stress UspA family protein
MSMKGARYAEAFRAAFAAELHVMHVCPVLVWNDTTVPLMSGGDILVSEIDLVTPAEAQLKRLIQEKFSDARNIKAKVVVGTAWHEICRYATEAQIDLVVIATHGATGLPHLLMGSTAERVVQHASAPVLTVKSIERDFVIPQTGDGPNSLKQPAC